MPDDPGRRGQDARLRRVVPVILLTVAAFVSSAAAAAADEGLSARLTIQYQRVEFDESGLGADGLPNTFTTTRSMWLQTYEVNHSARLSSRLRLLSQFKLTDLNYVDRPEGVRQPYGALRLTHPVFGLTGTHRPTTTTGAFPGTGFTEGGADSLGEEKITTRDRETALLGYLSVPRAPRIDLSWIRRSRDADAFGPGGAGTTRSARTSYAIGPLRLNGGYRDILRDPPGPAPEITDQRSLNGGAGLHIAPRRNANFDLSYNIFDTRRGVDTGNPARSRSHVANLTGSVQQSARTSWSTQYGYRRSEVATAADTAFDDHNASLGVTHKLTSVVTLGSSAGLRTQRVSARSDLVRYASATAHAVGAPRRGLRGTASLSHSSNWSDTRSPYSIQVARAGSILDLRRNLQLRTDAQVSSNSDSAARGRGTAGVFSSSVEGTPWRSLTVVLAIQRHQTGPGLFKPRSRSSSESVRLQWQPLAAFSMMGYVSRTGSLPDNDPRLTTQQWSARWSPGSQLQLTGSYMRSEQSSTSASAQQIRGREIYTLQLSAGLGAATRLDAGFSTADPKGERTSRQYDVAITRRFGS